MNSFLVRVRKYMWEGLESYLGKFITFHLRPIVSSDFKRTSSSTSSLPPYAIVLRGLIATENNFTLETLKLYTKLFPGAPLIVSTWDHTSEEALAPLRTVA